MYNWKTVVKHNNILFPNPGLDSPEHKYFHFFCIDCAKKERRKLWKKFKRSTWRAADLVLDNSFISIVEEFDNPDNPNVIAVICRGKYFGVLGHVDEETSAKIKNIIDTCSWYRVDPANRKTIGKEKIELILTWK